jgi:hypothetical protein
MASGKRGRLETHSMCRNRLRKEEEKAKEKRKGKIIWRSNMLGTYVIEKHGLIGRV